MHKDDGTYKHDMTIVQCTSDFIKHKVIQAVACHFLKTIYISVRANTAISYYTAHFFQTKLFTFRSIALLCCNGMTGHFLAFQ